VARVALVAMALVALWLAALVDLEYRGDWSALFCVGELAPMPGELSATYRWKDRNGYDGQYYRLVAHDPLDRRGYARYMDSPPLRYRRILAPALAHAAGFGRPAWIDWAFILVQIAAAGLGVWWSSAYLGARGRDPAWGLAFLLVPGVMTSFDRMLVDGLLTALFVGFLWYGESGAWKKAFAVVALACLARETGILLAAGAAVYSLLNGRRGRALWFAGAAVPALAWYGAVAWRIGLAESKPVPALPVIGIPWRIAAILADGGYSARMRAIDILALAGLLACVLLAVRWAAREPRSAAAPAMFLFACLALALGNPEFLEESYARPLSPLLAWVTLRAIGAGSWLLLAAPMAVSASVAVRVFVQPFMTSV
jgi:hypothetical protein